MNIWNILIGYWWSFKDLKSTQNLHRIVFIIWSCFENWVSFTIFQKIYVFTAILWTHSLLSIFSINSTDNVTLKPENFTFDGLTISQTVITFGSINLVWFKPNIEQSYNSFYTFLSLSLSANILKLLLPFDHCPFQQKSEAFTLYLNIETDFWSL